MLTNKQNNDDAKSEIDADETYMVLNDFLEIFQQGETYSRLSHPNSENTFQNDDDPCTSDARKSKYVKKLKNAIYMKNLDVFMVEA